MQRSGKLLKIYIGEGYYSGGHPVFETIVSEARRHGMGVTVLRGTEGVGHTGVLQDGENARNHDMPMVLEIIDLAENIEKFVPLAVKMMGNHGIAVTSDVSIVHRGVSLGGGSPPPGVVVDTSHDR